MVAADVPPHTHDGEVKSCPLCLLLDAVDGVRPEVAAHLRAAGREIAMALRVALEQVPSPDADRDSADGRGLRRIRLDDDADEGPPDDRA